MTEKITKEQVEALAKLYGEREQLQKVREAADRNFWLGVVSSHFKEGRRAELVDSLGGTGSFAAVLMRAVIDDIAAAQKELDAEIEALGGTP